MKESSVYQAGLQEGKIKGALAVLKKFVRRLGEHRFGPPDAQTEAALEGITDLQHLRAVGARVLHANSWQDLLGQPIRRRNGQRRRRN